MSEYFEPDELAAFSGARRKADQIEWLRANRIPFLVDTKGRAKVLRATVAAILGAPGNSSGPEMFPPLSNTESMGRPAQAIDSEGMENE